jgi:hypothetical protein
MVGGNSKISRDVVSLGRRSVSLLVLTVLSLRFIIVRILIFQRMSGVFLFV